MMRALISYFISICLLLPSLSLGQVGGGVKALATAVEESAVKSSSEELGKLGVAYARRGSTDEMYFYNFFNSENKLIRQIQVPRAAPEVLEASKPSKFVALWNNTKKAGKAGAVGAVSQLRRFPVEAFTFFVALGAISTENLIFDYDSNPAAYDELLTGQADPVTQLGFAAFMMANGATSQSLLSISQSPRLHFFLPSLGMTVGTIASKVVSEVGHFPGLVDCALKKDPEQCDKTYKAWAEYSFKKDALSLMPSLTAMIATTLLTGGIKMLGYQAIEVASKIAAVQAIKVATMNVALSIGPSGLAVRGVEVGMWGLQVAELAGFINTSSYIEVPLTKIWNNAVTLGPKIIDTRAELIGNIYSQNLSKVPENLANFSELMNEWRQNNSIDTLTSQNKWAGFLANLSAGYNVSKLFYSNFLTDLWNTRYNKYKAEYANIKGTYPLYGVNMPNGNPAPSGNYLMLQDVTEEGQIKSLNTIAEKMTQIIVHPNFKKMNSTEQMIMIGLQKAFAGKDTAKMAQAITQINQILKLSPGPSDLSPRSYSQSFMAFISIFHLMIGKATPFTAEGKGYLTALNATYIEQGLINPFPKYYGRIMMPTAPEYLIKQMYAGPDLSKQDSVIQGTLTGFKAKFVGPKIRLGGKYQDLDLALMGSPDATQPLDIFNMTFWASQKDESLKAERNLYQSLLNSNIDPKILGDASGPLVDKWWTNNVEPQYVQAFIDYEAKYQLIVQNLYRDLWKDDKEASNFTGLPNGIVASTSLEIDLYLSLLENMAPKATEFAVVKKQILQQVQKLHWQLAQIRLATRQYMGSDAQFHLVSRISNAEITSTETALAKISNDYIDALLALKENEDPSRKEVLTTLKTVLKTAYDVFGTYGKIVNVVSYKERYAVDGKDAGADCITTPNGTKTKDQLKGDLQACAAKNAPAVVPAASQKPTPAK